MNMEKYGYYFILNGDNDEIEKYKKIAVDYVEIFRDNGNWFLSSDAIREEKDYSSAKNIAEGYLKLLHGITTLYIGCSYNIRINGFVNKTKDDTNTTLTKEIACTVTVVKDFRNEDINCAKELFRIAIQNKERSDYKLSEILKILKNGYPLDYYDSYKVIELIGKDRCMKVIGERFDELKANLNSEYHQGENARHSRVTNRKDEMKVRKLSKDEIDKNIRGIINNYIKDLCNDMMAES